MKTVFRDIYRTQVNILWCTWWASDWVVSMS